jgi:hypothetical protein
MIKLYVKFDNISSREFDMDWMMNVPDQLARHSVNMAQLIMSTILPSATKAPIHCSIRAFFMHWFHFCFNFSIFPSSWEHTKTLYSDFPHCIARVKG